MKWFAVLVSLWKWFVRPQDVPVGATVFKDEAGRTFVPVETPKTAQVAPADTLTHYVATSKTSYYKIGNKWFEWGSINSQSLPRVSLVDSPPHITRLEHLAAPIENANNEIKWDGATVERAVKSVRV